MIIPQEKIDEAKHIYGDKAIQEIVEYFGITKWDEKAKKGCCPFHNEHSPSFIWNDKGCYFKCFGCSKNYGILDLYMEQGMTYLEAVKKLFNNTNINYNFSMQGVQTEHSYKYPKREISPNGKDKVEAYMASRCISKKTLDYADIQEDKNGNAVFHFYDANDVLKTVKYRPSHKIKDGEAKCWAQKDADFAPLLFNMNRIDPSKPLIITEGPMDTLAIIESGYTNAVSVPNGCMNMKWIEYNYEWLEQFQKIIIWGDNDEPGIKMRNDACNRLGTWRTYYIEINPNDVKKNGQICKDANEILYYYGKDKVLEYINHPIELPVQGVLDLSKAEEFDIENAEGLYTGIEDLDKQIYKLVFGTLNIITGRSGCVDCDTEFFNGIEWKKISDYTEGEKVLQYNVDGTAELVIPEKYHKYEANNLWRLNTKYGLDMCVSDEHNIYYKTSKGNLYSTTFDKFKEVHERSINGHQGKFITTFKYGGKGIKLTDNQIKLMLAVICDGSFDKRKNNNYCRVNLKKDRKKVELENLLNDIGVKYIRKDRNDGYSCFYFDAPIRTKKFTSDWYNCSNHQLNIIVENIYKWDGDKYGNSYRFFTTDKDNADFIQFAYSSCGLRSTLKVKDRTGRIRTLKGKQYTTKSIDYVVNATTRNLIGISVCGKYNNKKTEIVPYKTIDGYKYCFTVPSHMWIMRRNGKICITGNSGKSVFVNQVAICQALQQGYDVFAFSGELPAPVLKTWVETNMIGRDHITMDKTGHIRRFDLKARKEMENWYSGRVMVYDDSVDTTAKTLLNKMEEMARKYGTKVFLIDNLMMIDLECDEESRLQAEKEFIKNLIFFAKKYNVLVFLVAHPRKTGELRLTKDDISGSSNIVNLAHMVFSVHRYTDSEKEGEDNGRGGYYKGKEPIKYDAVVEVLKNRITGLLPKTELYFDYPSYRFYRTPSELWLRYKWNADNSPLRNDDPNPHEIQEDSPLE